MGEWTCIKCGRKFKDCKNVGLTNSVTERSICIKCYNEHNCPYERYGEPCQCKDMEV